MKSMTLVTLVAITVTSLTGCCRGWPRLFHRGDSCAPNCVSGMSGVYEGTELGTGPALMAPTIIPQRPTELPGPVMSTPAA